MNKGDNETAFDDDGGPEIPQGVLRSSKRRGWAGEGLELQHQREHEGKNDDYTAVDIRQFQNTVVGSGYQARGVIRQKTASDGTTVRDLTRSNTDDKEKPIQRQSDTHSRETRCQKVERYISCEGIREFRKEIEQLIKSSS